MAQVSHAAASPDMVMHAPASHVLRRTIVIGLTAFLTVVDLFATQAILPSLAKAYHVAPAAMGLAVNASTLGMAVAGLAVAFFSRRIADAVVQGAIRRIDCTGSVSGPLASRPRRHGRQVRRDPYRTRQTALN